MEGDDLRQNPNPNPNPDPGSGVCIQSLAGMIAVGRRGVVHHLVLSRVQKSPKITCLPVRVPGDLLGLSRIVPLHG